MVVFSLANAEIHRLKLSNTAKTIEVYFFIISLLFTNLRVKTINFLQVSFLQLTDGIFIAFTVQI